MLGFEITFNWPEHSSYESVLYNFFFEISISSILTVKIERMFCLVISLNEAGAVKGM